MMPILLHLITAGLYGALGVHFWRALKTSPSMAEQRGLRPTERLALLLPILVHGLMLLADVTHPGGVEFGFSVSLSLMLWLALVAYWLQSFSARIEGLLILALPLASVSVLLPLIFPATHPLERISSPLFRAHFVMAMLAYALAMLAALHAVLMALAERQLHKGQLSRALASLPPLLTMEAMLFRLISVAFALLTLALGSGALFSETVFGQALRLDHKTVFSITSWCLFAGLLFGRLRWGWRGRVALQWTLAGFAVLLLAYVGSRVVLEVLLGRA